MIENKAKIQNDMEKEKQALIIKFENAFKKKKQIDAEIVKELFPEDEELYNRIKDMTDKMYRTTRTSNENNTTKNNFSLTAHNYSKNEIKNKLKET